MIKLSNLVEWKKIYQAADLALIREAELKLDRKFPSLFKDLISECDGCVPKKSTFDYYNHVDKKKSSSSIGCFLSINDDEFLNYALQPPEFFPEGLVAFSDTGGGDLICFDYRAIHTTDNPPIVFWEHDAHISENETGYEDVFWVSKNFEDFFNMLYSPG